MLKFFVYSTIPRRSGIVKKKHCERQNIGSFLTVYLYRMHFCIKKISLAFTFWIMLKTIYSRGSKTYHIIIRDKFLKIKLYFKHHIHLRSETYKSLVAVRSPVGPYLPGVDPWRCHLFGCWSLRWVCWLAWSSLPRIIIRFEGRIQRMVCTSLLLCTGHHGRALCIFYLSWPGARPSRAFSSLFNFRGYCSSTHLFDPFSFCAAWVWMNSLFL